MEDLYARGEQARTQYLIPKAEADTRLGIPAPVSDPYAMMPRNALRAPGSDVPRCLGSQADPALAAAVS